MNNNYPTGSMTHLADFHMHCSFSSDSEATPESMVQQALTYGLHSICFTDHNDYNYPLEDGKVVFQLDFNSYVEKIRSLRDQYADQIQILIGVEQGLQASLSDRINNYDPDHVLDFIIGSSHLVNGKDPYYKEYWNDVSVHDSITEYYQSIIDNISACSNYDVYGHLDYIIRYAPEQDRNYNWYDYSDMIDLILKELIEKGKGIEINTAGLKYGLKNANPCPDIVKRYHELGGEIITIGSDGHKIEHLAYDFHLIPELLSQAGFDYYTVFKNRRPEFIKL